MKILANDCGHGLEIGISVDASNPLQGRSTNYEQPRVARRTRDPGLDAFDPFGMSVNVQSLNSGVAWADESAFGAMALSEIFQGEKPRKPPV